MGVIQTSLIVYFENIITHFLKSSWNLLCDKKKSRPTQCQDNESCIKTVDKTCGKPPEILGCLENPEQDRETIKHIIQHFK